jgi:hypothetical protein
MPTSNPITLPTVKKSKTVRLDAEVVTDAHAGESLVNTFHRCAQTAAAQATAYAILCGLELQRTRAEIAAPGKRSDLRHPGGGGWQDWVAENCNFSLTTAKKYMAVAEGVKGRLAQSNLSKSLAAIIDTAPSALGEDQRQSLIQSVAKVTHGDSLRDLYMDFGITKANPHQNLRKGGATHTKGSKSSRNLDAEDAQEYATRILIDLAKFIQGGNHQHLSHADLDHFDQQLLSARQTIRPLLKS